MNLPFGYIDRFIDVGFNTANIKPLACRLRGGSTSRIITLASGEAFNAGSPDLPGPWPVEQELRILIRASTPGGGIEVDSLLQAIAAKQGYQGALRVRVPGGVKFYSAQAILDYPEIVSEGSMKDAGVINWVVVALHFSQLTPFV